MNLHICLIYNLIKKVKRRGNCPISNCVRVEKERNIYVLNAYKIYGRPVCICISREIHILISCIQDWDSEFEMLIRVKRKKADDDARKIKGIVSADVANLHEPAQLFRQLVANTLNQGASLLYPAMGMTMIARARERRRSA